MNAPLSPAVEIHDCRMNMGSSGDDSVCFFLDALRIESGVEAALTGPSGCGKTTLLNLIAGLRRPQSGTVSIHGTNLMGLSPSRLDTFRGRTMGFVFQTFNLLDGFSALENVVMGMRFGRARPHTEWKARATALLERVGLKRQMHVRPGRLSVGERQRVAIARAIANRPALLLADEPTGSLDPATAGVVFQLIREVCQEEHCALLLVTHDLELAARLPRQVDCRNLIQHSSVSEAHA